MKNAIILITVLGFLACKKSSNNNSGNNNNTNPNLDTENYVTIDGVTNYHYTTPNIPSVGCQSVNGTDMYNWANRNPQAPEYGAMVSLLGFSSAIMHFKNGALKTYYLRLWKNLPTTTVNGKTTVDFKDLKAYIDINDTTKGYVLASGRITCNGK